MSAHRVAATPGAHPTDVGADVRDLPRKLVQSLPDGPLDIIGDVHGELPALVRLLRRLGCDPEAATVTRPLVFVGDLIDRGPDSPGVVRLVQRLVEAGVAQVVMGNHELNALLAEPKEGNGWLLGQPDGVKHRGRVRPLDSVAATPAERASFAAFFGSLPLALARRDLRVVHACWSDHALASLPDSAAIRPLARTIQRRIGQLLAERDLPARADAERRREGGLRDPDRPPRGPLTATLEQTVLLQREDPLKVITSGPEEPLPDGTPPFYVAGRWRVVERSQWWRRYQDDAAVVFGHYWRRRGAPSTDRRDLFTGAGPFAWLGPRGNALCVDYSVGRRFLERWEGQRDGGYTGALAALRWPERELVFDDRDTPVQTTGFGEPI